MLLRDSFVLYFIFKILLCFSAQQSNDDFADFTAFNATKPTTPDEFGDFNAFGNTSTSTAQASTSLEVFHYMLSDSNAHYQPYESIKSSGVRKNAAP